MTTDATNANGDAPAPRRARPSPTLGLITAALVVATAWLRFGPGLWTAPPKVGSHLPPARLDRLEGSEPLLLLGIEGRVTWLVFLSAESAEGLAALPRLEAAWNRLRPSRRFAMVAAAVDQGGPDRIRAALGGFEGRGRLPLYRADADARRAFGVDGADPPWHFLVDPEGRIAAIARGSGEDMIGRLARQAGRWLDAMGPLDRARLASRTDVVGGVGGR